MDEEKFFIRRQKSIRDKNQEGKIGKVGKYGSNRRVQKNGSHKNGLKQTGLNGRGEIFYKETKINKGQKSRRKNRKSRKIWFKQTGPKKRVTQKRVEIDGSKWTGLNRWVKIARFKQKGPNRRVHIDVFKKLGQTYRSKKTGPNRGYKSKLKCHQK